MTISPTSNHVRFGAVYVMTPEAERRYKEAMEWFDPLASQKREAVYHPTIKRESNIYVTAMTRDNGFLGFLHLFSYQPFAVDGFTHILLSNTGSPDLDNFKERHSQDVFGGEKTFEQLQLDFYNQAKEEGRLNVIS